MGVDKRGFNTGKCKDCECIEYETEGKLLCAYCGHPPMQHVVMPDLSYFTDEIHDKRSRKDELDQGAMQSIYRSNEDLSSALSKSPDHEPDHEVTEDDNSSFGNQKDNVLDNIQLSATAMIPQEERTF